MADVEEEFDEDDCEAELWELRLYSNRNDVGEVTLCCRSVICENKRRREGTLSDDDVCANCEVANAEVRNSLSDASGATQV